MKIALISHLYPTKLFPFSGKFIKDHFDLLCEQESIEVDLIIPTPYSIPGTKRFKKNMSIPVGACKSINKVHYLSFPNKSFPSSIKSNLSRSLLAFLKGKKYDLIHIHWLFPDGLAIPDLKKHGFKTILTIHGSDWYSIKSNYKFESKLSLIFESLSYLLVSGPDLYKDILNKYSFLDKKIEIINNLVDYRSYPIPSIDEKINAQTKLGWDTKKKHALTIGYNRHEKGIDILLEAIKNLPNDMEYHIITDVQNYDSSLLHRIKNSKNISLHSPIPPQNLLEYYHASDLYIQPSRREGFGLALVEASSTGLPFVSTPVGVAPLLAKKGFGITSKQISPLSLREAILSQKIHNHSKQTQEITNLFGVDSFRSKLLSIYQEVLNS